MRDISSEILKLLEKYGGDIKTALRENSCLEYFYALSDIRENVLEWLPFQKTDDVLQIGSDYGAVTGLLARRCGQVTVLDENGDNLYVNERRHRQKENITYVNCRLEEASDRLFDYVIFIGSLNQPYKTKLQAAKALLKPGGAVVLAVCNFNGIKYWAGAREDDNSMTRAELKELISDALGEGQEKWYYPVPDYKTAYAVYSEDYLPQKGDLTNPLPAYDYPKFLQMEDGKALDEICERNQFEHYANSFLVIWRSPWRK